MIANGLTLLRILLIPLIMWTFYVPGRLSPWIAAIAFMIACITDFLDGAIARCRKEVTKFGQFLDPVADKLLVASTLLCLAGFGRLESLTLLPATVILCREILVSSLRGYLGKLRLPTSSSLLPKWKTASQMLAIGCLLLGATPSLGTLPLKIGKILLWGAALLTLWSGYLYIRAAQFYLLGKVEE